MAQKYSKQDHVLKNQSQKQNVNLFIVDGMFSYANI